MKGKTVEIEISDSLYQRLEEVMNQKHLSLDEILSLLCPQDHRGHELNI